MRQVRSWQELAHEKDQVVNQSGGYGFVDPRTLTWYTRFITNQILYADPDLCRELISSVVYDIIDKNHLDLEDVTHHRQIATLTGLRLATILSGTNPTQTMIDTIITLVQNPKMLESANQDDYYRSHISTLYAALVYFRKINPRSISFENFMPVLIEQLFVNEGYDMRTDWDFVARCAKWTLSLRDIIASDFATFIQNP